MPDMLPEHLLRRDTMTNQIHEIKSVRKFSDIFSKTCSLTRSTRKQDIKACRQVSPYLSENVRYIALDILRPLQLPQFFLVFNSDMSDIKAISMATIDHSTLLNHVRRKDRSYSA